MPQVAAAAELSDVFALAGSYDPSVRIAPRSFARLRRLALLPTAYGRATLFERMAAGEPCILTGFPAPLRGALRDLAPAEAGHAVIAWFAARRSATAHRVFAGTTGVRRHLTLRQIAGKWQANRTRFGVTDLHIRNSSLEAVIAPEVLSDFNLLPQSTAGAQEQEMFSFVISSRGQVTDSHSDDPDSSNYCIVGTKLWLIWDTYEGMRAGLQDVERVPVYGRARFSMETWLSLRSARWFLVRPGQTLFLPAHFTHKVITLEPYIGVGGFFVALPNSLRLLAHWILRGPLWSKRDATGHRDELLGEIADSVRSTIVALREGRQSERERWGYDHLPAAAAHLVARCTAGELRLLWSDPRFRAIAETVAAPWPGDQHRNARHRAAGQAQPGPSPSTSKPTRVRLRGSPL